MEGRTCLACRLGCCSPVGSVQHRPRRQPRPVRGRPPLALARPSTRTAQGAAAPCSQDIRHANKKRRGKHSAYLSVFGRGRRTWSPLRSGRLVTCVPLARTRPSARGLGVDVETAHWGNGGGAVLPGSPEQVPKEWCWFGAGDEELQVRQGNGDNLRNSFASSVGPAAQNHKEDGSSHYRPVGENQL